MFGDLIGWVTDVIARLGYVGLAGLIAMENLFPPIPSEVILPLAGFLAGRGRLSFLGAVAAATAGSVLGAYVLYGLGRKLGKRRVHRLVARYGRWMLVDEEDLDRASGWFDRHGGIAVLIGRCVPGVRSLVSIPAGINQMPLGRFTIYTALGSALWNTLLIGLGFVLGDQWQVVRRYVEYVEYGIWAVIIAAVVWFVWRRWRSFGGRSQR